MNRIVSGILRLVVVLTTLIILFHKFLTNSFYNEGVLLLVSLFAMNAILYMVFNAIKDFEGKNIGLKPAYVIFLIWNLISLHVAIRILFNSPFSGFLAPTNTVDTVIGYYFIIYDFIQHWLKKSTSVKINSNGDATNI